MAEMRRVRLAVDTVGAFGRQVVEGVARAALEFGDWDLELPPRWLFHNDQGFWQDWQIDGLIVQAHAPAMLERVHLEGVPAVNVSTAGETLLPSVVADNVAIGRLAATDLLGRGFRRFAVIGLYEHGGFVTPRASGFVRALADAGLPCHAEPQLGSIGDNVVPDIRDPRAWLVAVEKPLAVFTCSDDRAERVLSMCRDAGVWVPERVAILGVDDDPLVHRMVRPSLSSIDPGAERVGYEAAQLLRRLMAGKPAGKTVYVPPARVVTRQSTEVLATTDPEVAEALRVIRQHACDHLGVAEVLRRVPISRRALERRFQKAVGRTLLQEIHRVRLERAKQLLAETRLSVPDVARRSGFGNPWRFGATFRRATGQTPTTYRRLSGRG